LEVEYSRARIIGGLLKNIILVMVA